MVHKSDLIEKDIVSYLEHHKNKDILRFLTCGSVDDGKSTLIGRLLFESKLIFDDQLSSLTGISKKYGTTGEKLDLALLVDGLAAEREQGITIDVAYRFFSTDKRKFIVADTPGHEQYTRNMATGAATADLAIVMIDATKGILTQTRRHSYIVSLLGVKHIILAVNKMDLIDYNQQKFNTIANEYREFAQNLGFESITAIPVSALEGDNFISLSNATPWYKGEPLISYLENIDVQRSKENVEFCMPVQWVNRHSSSFRGYAGQVASGQIKPNEKIKILPSGQTSTINKIVTYDQELESASTGRAITVTLHDEIDISRGDVVVSSNNSQCEVANQVSATIIWMNNKELIHSRQYVLHLATSSTVCTLSKPKHRVDINTMELVPATTLMLNEIGDVDLRFNKPLVLSTYKNLPKLGSFILIDRITNETVACGMVNHILQPSQNIYPDTQITNRELRAGIKQQTPKVIWMTGLPSAGKTTIAIALEKKLIELDKHAMILDGDHLRSGLNKDLGFTEQDRAENIRRVAEVSKLMIDAGLIVIVSFISPFSSNRQMAAELIGQDDFLEVFIDTPLDIAEERDVKGLYKKARAGEITDFTGINSPYEKPENPDITLSTIETTPDELADKIITVLGY